jgi:transcriptional regulator with XRE-family HTH domain
MFVNIAFTCRTIVSVKSTPKIETSFWAMEVAELARRTERHSGETVGERLARIRRERGITQAELAEKLGLAQPNVSDYERGILRLNADLILKLTDILKVSADELLGLREPKLSGSVKNRRLARRLEEIERLPRRDQEALLRTIDAFLTKAM